MILQFWETPSIEHHGWPSGKVTARPTSTSTQRKKHTQKVEPTPPKTLISEQGSAQTLSLDSMLNDCYTSSWKCTVCLVNFDKKDLLKRHMKGHLNQLDHKCSYCERTFWKKEDLDGHVANIHTNQKLFHCQICGNFFSYKRSLRLHLKNVHHTDWRDVTHS